MSGNGTQTISDRRARRRERRPFSVVIAARTAHDRRATTGEITGRPSHRPSYAVARRSRILRGAATAGGLMFHEEETGLASWRAPTTQRHGMLTR